VIDVALRLQGCADDTEHIGAGRDFNVGADRHRRAEYAQASGERIAEAHLQLNVGGDGELHPTPSKLVQLFVSQVIAVNDVGLIADEIVRNDSLEPVAADWRDAGHMHACNEVKLAGKLQILTRHIINGIRRAEGGCRCGYHI